MPATAVQAALPAQAEEAQPARKPRGPIHVWNREEARIMGARGHAVMRARLKAQALAPPPIALPDQIAAHVINVRRQLERIHEKIMSTSDTRALERLVKVQAQLILSEKELLKQAEKPAEVTPPQASDFRPGAVSKSVAAPK